MVNPLPLTGRLRWLAILCVAFSALTLSPTGAVDDDLTPRLLSASLESQGPLIPGDTARITFAAEDDLTPGSNGLFSEAFARYTTPLDGYVDLVAVITQGALSPTLELEISPLMVGGAYTLQYIQVTDSASNSVSCSEDGLSGWSTDGEVADNPCPESLENMNFTVTNATGDSDAPVLDAQPLIPTDTYEPGESTSVNYSASDPTSGVVDVQFLFKNGGPSPYYVVGFKTGLGAGTGPMTLQTYSNTPGGLYTLDQVRLKDAAGYDVTYFADGTVTRYPSLITGPDTHSFDFNQGFVVNSPGTLDDIYPRAVYVDHVPSTFTLLVMGQGFNAESTLSVDNTLIPTTFISETLLSGEVSANLISVKPAGHNYAIRLSYGDLPTPPAQAELEILVGTAESTSDVNLDGCVDAFDAFQVMRFLSGLPPSATQPPGCTPFFAPRVVAANDADRDGDVDVGDAVHIRRVVAGEVPE